MRNKTGLVTAAARAGAALAGATIGGPFTLVDGTGATVTEAEVPTGPSPVGSGHTFRPDPCPTDKARTAEAIDLLAARGNMARRNCSSRPCQSLTRSDGCANSPTISSPH